MFDLVQIVPNDLELLDIPCAKVSRNCEITGLEISPPICGDAWYLFRKSIAKTVRLTT